MISEIIAKDPFLHNFSGLKEMSLWFLKTVHHFRRIKVLENSSFKKYFNVSTVSVALQPFNERQWCERTHGHNFLSLNILNRREQHVCSQKSICILTVSCCEHFFLREWEFLWSELHSSLSAWQLWSPIHQIWSHCMFWHLILCRGAEVILLYFGLGLQLRIILNSSADYFSSLIINKTTLHNLLIDWLIEKWLIKYKTKK